jgi:hypothetical protein
MVGENVRSGGVLRAPGITGRGVLLMKWTYRFRDSKTGKVYKFKGETFLDCLRQATNYAFEHHLLLIY